MARQAWRRKGELDRNVLEHIRAMLLVLAALVERAAVLPTAKRLWFLAVMASGEAEARRLILAMAYDPSLGIPAEATAAPPIVTGDAALLGARFRMLALAVDALLALAGPRSSCPHASSSALLPGHNPRGAAQWTPSLAPRATSPPAGAGQSHMEIAPMVLARYPHP